MFDLLIRNGMVLDGTGALRFLGDVAVKGDRIVEIAPHIEGEAVRVIDAEGLFVTPGFIDIHDHSDEIVFIPRPAHNKLEQGITFQLSGQCGDSPTPYAPGNLPKFEKLMSEDEMARIKAICADPRSFMKEAEQQNFHTNVAFLVGHQALRAYSIGYENVEPSEGQMRTMEGMVATAMESGYFGMSSGLVYAPSVYAKTEELSQLAKVAARYGGIYASHIRGEGNKVENAVAEAIAIGKESGAKVLISHLKVMGKHNRGKSTRLLEMIDEANASGQVVRADQYPFEAGSAPMLTQLPPKYLVGGNDAALERLKDPAMRKKIEWSVFNEPEEFESCLYFSGYEGTIVAESPYKPEYVGKTVGQIAEELGKDPFDAYCDLLLENKGIAQGVYICQNMDDILRIMAHPVVFAGTDWSALEERYAPDKRGGGHPRSSSTMVRRLELQRKYGLCTAEEAIARITGLPAQFMGLRDCGFLKEGYAADICVIDYPNLKCNADYDFPFRRNNGIKFVVVNGQVVVEEGVANDIKAGKVYKHECK